MFMFKHRNRMVRSRIQWGTTLGSTSLEDEPRFENKPSTSSLSSNANSERQVEGFSVTEPLCPLMLVSREAINFTGPNLGDSLGRRIIF